MRNYTNGYAEKIKYWTTRYNEAFSAGNVENIKFALARINYFTEKHCELLEEKAKAANSKPITVGSVVRYKKGWSRVSKVTKNSVNLRGVFGNRITDKNVPLTEVYEDEAGWYANWTKSETYMCM